MPSLVWALMLSFLPCFLDSASYEDPQEIESISGDDVLLPCQGPRDANVLLVTWVRPDLKSEGVVFFWRENHIYEDFQHESFHGRVELIDPEMTDGDYSVILKNVNINDTGTYECQIRSFNPEHSWTLTEQRHEIKLKVTDIVKETITAKPGQTITLTCQAPKHIYIRMLKWSRTDVEQENVLLRLGDWWDQHSSFRDGVELKHSWRNDGDVSLILKDVTVKDTGTYECRIYGRTDYWVTFETPICIINLDVREAGGGAGHTEDGGDKQRVSNIVQVVTLLVVVVVHIVGTGLFIYRKCKVLKEQSYSPPSDKAEELELHDFTPEVLETMTEQDETAVETRVDILEQ